MSDLVKQVTPQTRGIIWLVKDETNTNNPNYSQMDYLLDGLLTSNLRESNDVSSRVIVGQNFNQPLFVLIVKEVKSAEVSSFLSLLKNLTPENDVIVIDEVNGLDRLKNDLKPISANLKHL